MEATLRRGLVTIWLILLISLGWSAPSAAQTQDGWTIQVEANAGYFKSTRDIGKILGTEVQATIITDLQAAPLYSVGVVLSGPSPNFSLRAGVGYMTTEARGQSIGCDEDEGIIGPGCVEYDIPTTAVMGFFDVLLHNDETGSGTLKYFIAGLGLRSYTFDELGCQDLDANRFAVCSPMEELLADQVGIIFKVGLGIRGRGGPVGWNLELTDLVSRFKGSGLRGEGGPQNDFVVSAGLSFPGG